MAGAYECALSRSAAPTWAPTARRVLVARVDDRRDPLVAHPEQLPDLLQRGPLGVQGAGVRSPQPAPGIDQVLEVLGDPRDDQGLAVGRDLAVGLAALALGSDDFGAGEHPSRPLGVLLQSIDDLPEHLEDGVVTGRTARRTAAASGGHGPPVSRRSTQADFERARSMRATLQRPPSQSRWSRQRPRAAPSSVASTRAEPAGVMCSECRSITRR